MSAPLTESDISLNNLQKEFLKWTMNWAKGRDTLKQRSADIPDLVSLLKAIGFTENAPGKGIKVTVECSTHNKKKTFLKPFRKNCVDDLLWMVDRDMTTFEPVQSPLPKMTKELRQVIQSVVNCLLNMLNGTFVVTNEAEEAETSTKSETEPTRNAQYPVSRENDNVSPSSDASSSDDTLTNDDILSNTDVKKAAKALGVSTSALSDILKFVQNHPTEEGIRMLEACYFIFSRSPKPIQDVSDMKFCLDQSLITTKAFGEVISAIKQCLHHEDS